MPIKHERIIDGFVFQDVFDRPALGNTNWKTISGFWGLEAIDNKNWLFGAEFIAGRRIHTINAVESDVVFLRFLPGLMWLRKTEWDVGTHAYITTEEGQFCGINIIVRYDQNVNSGYIFRIESKQIVGGDIQTVVQIIKRVEGVDTLLADEFNTTFGYYIGIGVPLAIKIICNDGSQKLTIQDATGLLAAPLEISSTDVTFDAYDGQLAIETITPTDRFEGDVSDGVTDGGFHPTTYAWYDANVSVVPVDIINNTLDEIPNRVHITDLVCYRGNDITFEGLSNDWKLQINQVDGTVDYLTAIANKIIYDYPFEYFFDLIYRTDKLVDSLAVTDNNNIRLRFFDEVFDGLFTGGTHYKLYDFRTLPYPYSNLVIPPTWRNSKEFLTTPIGTLNDTSIKRRPDAISFDYQTAYSFGPVDISDTSLGIFNRAWRARTDGRNIKFSKANDDNTEWEDEVTVYVFSGDSIDELDITFDQNGRPFVCAERDRDIWIYWFDPTLGDYKFEKICEGRTPRCILDNPLDVTSSDVILFYINEEKERVCYRLQRDRYLVEYDSPLIFADGNFFLQRASLTEDNRVKLIYAMRYPIEQRYIIGELLSAIYPIILDPEALELDYTVIIASNTIVVIVYSFDEALNVGYTIADVLNFDPVISRTIEIEEFDLAYEIASLDVLVPGLVIPEVEALNFAYALVTVTNTVVLIVYTTEIEELDFAYTVESADCFVP